MKPHLATLIFALALGLAGCAPGLSPSQQASLDRVSHELDQQLTPAGQVAATVALIHEDTGAYPVTQFELLGSPQARQSGMLFRNLSQLELEPIGEALRVRFVLLPTPEDPSDRIATVWVRPTDGDGQYEAEVELVRRDDPDHTARPLFLTQQDPFAVTRLSGTFCIDVGTVREQVAVGEAGDLPLDARPYTITFTPAPGSFEGVPRDLIEGHTVTIES